VLILKGFYAEQWIKWSKSAIWQKGEFMDFRKEVVEYRFPFCFDCSFALCNLVDGADFENDCYISQVPCGACLWCTGLFNCLL
jgi:hypothetical protein